MVRTVLVTGANRGLGLEFVRQFAEQGDRVIATCRRVSSELAEIAVPTVTLDLADESSIARARRKIGEMTDRIEVLVNNAGVANSGVWEDSENLGTLTQKGLLDVFRVNAAGPLLLTQACLDLLKNGDQPRVAFVSSLFSQIGPRPEFFANNFAYSASKVSLNLFAKSLAILLEKDGVMSVAVDPGWVRTDMGGPHAELSIKESVTGLVNVIDGLTTEQNGAYVSWTGETLAY